MPASSEQRFSMESASKRTMKEENFSSDQYGVSPSLRSVYCPLPYRLPLHPYREEGKLDVPWIWDISHKERDIFGSRWLQDD